MTTPLLNAADRDLLRAALDGALDQLRGLLAEFGPRFPDDTAPHDRYRPRRWLDLPDGANSGWTTGFWTGMLWLAHELSGETGFREAAEGHLASFEERLERRIQIDHHDLGFLYMPSCVAAWRLRGDTQARAVALGAADYLMRRYLPRAGIIQAWGDLDDPAQRGRMIIDCLMNLPLLHWAARASGEPRYRDAALRHLDLSRDYLVRADDSSFHTYHFDPETGTPLYGSTAQGLADDSCWARGQAWGVYGFALNHRHAPDLGLLGVARRQADYFIRHLPPNGIAYWDLAFGQGSAEPWDSSASAIAACGLLELAGHLDADDVDAAHDYRAAALHMLRGLATHCAARAPASNALLLHGVYSKPHGQGVDEPSLWGDYFYLEGLARVLHGANGYW